MLFCRREFQELSRRQQVLTLAGGRVTPHQTLAQMLADNRLIPKSLVAEQIQDRITIAIRPWLNSPPKKQRNMDVIDVFTPLSQPLRNWQRLRRRQPPGRASQLAADFDVGIAIGKVD